MLLLLRLSLALPSLFLLLLLLSTVIVAMPIIILVIFFYRCHGDVTAALAAMIFARPPCQQWNGNARHQQRKELLRRLQDVSVAVVESSNHHRSEKKWRKRWVHQEG